MPDYSTEGNNNYPSGTMHIATQYEYKKEVTTPVVAKMTQAENGRYVSMTVTGAEDGNPEEFAGKSFALSATRTKDEDAYEQAYNDYKYNMEVYNKAISDIDAQTKQIQRKDQQLELRLEQLDTEQNAIQTEMEAVQKVIENNVEKTFNVFG